MQGVKEQWAVACHRHHTFCLFVVWFVFNGPGVQRKVGRLLQSRIRRHVPKDPFLINSCVPHKRRGTLFKSKCRHSPSSPLSSLCSCSLRHRVEVRTFPVQTSEHLIRIVLDQHLLVVFLGFWLFVISVEIIHLLVSVVFAQKLLLGLFCQRFRLIKDGHLPINVTSRVSVAQLVGARDCQSLGRRFDSV